MKHEHNPQVKAIKACSLISNYLQKFYHTMKTISNLITSSIGNSCRSKDSSSRIQIMSWDNHLQSLVWCKAQRSISCQTRLNNKLSLPLPNFFTLDKKAGNLSALHYLNHSTRLLISNTISSTSSSQTIQTRSTIRDKTQYRHSPTHFKTRTRSIHHLWMLLSIATSRH